MLTQRVKPYGKVNNQIIHALIDISGETSIILDNDRIYEYSIDATEMSRIGKYADIIVLPNNTQEVSDITKLAYDNDIPILPRGAGTNLSGGCVPLEGGIVLSMEKMNRILEIDTANFITRIQPGVINGDLQDAVEKAGLFYPPDPGSLRTSTLGGNIAESASGPRCFKYGGTKDYVMGLEVVLANGDIIRTGGPTIKNVTGYNTTQLFVGSEGTLGIITEAILKLIPYPEDKKTLLAIYPNFDDAADTVFKIIEAKIIPSALEFMDHNTMKTVEKFHPTGLPTNVDACLLIEVDGMKAVVEQQAYQIEAICKQYGASEIRLAKNREQAENIWYARRNAYNAMSQLGPNVVTEDAVVPRSEIPTLMKKVKAISEKYNLTLGMMGHAGDGNIHPNYAVDLQNSDERKRLELAIEEIYEASLALGGTLSGEHGIGMEKKKFLPKFLTHQEISVLKSIKLALDPKLILNPGKIF